MFLTSVRVRNILILCREGLILRPKPALSCRAKLLLIAVAAMSLVVLQGCQTLSRRRTQTIPATSRPAGIKVIVDGEAAGETPVRLKLARRADHVVRFEADGYRPVEVRITRKRPTLGETILTSFFWAPVGAAAMVIPGTLALSLVTEPVEEWGYLGQAFYSAAFGFVLGWTLGTVVDYNSKSNYDLFPQTIFFEMEKAEGTAPPLVVEVEPDRSGEIRWIRVALSER
jgi:hypothetical protein